MSACRSGCATPGAHKNWGDCLRDAGVQIDRHGLRHSGVEKDKDRRLTRYEDARRQGLQPSSTDWKDVRAAFETGGEKG